MEMCRKTSYCIALRTSLAEQRETETSIRCQDGSVRTYQSFMKMGGIYQIFFWGNGASSPEVHMNGAWKVGGGDNEDGAFERGRVSNVQLEIGHRGRAKMGEEKGGKKLQTPRMKDEQSRRR